MHVRVVCVCVSERKFNSFIHSMIIFYLDAMSRPLDVSRAGDIIFKGLN